MMFYEQPYSSTQQAREQVPERNRNPRRLTRLATPAKDSANQDNVSGINPLVNQRMSQNKRTHQSTSNPGFVCFKHFKGVMITLGECQRH